MIYFLERDNQLIEIQDYGELMLINRIKWVYTETIRHAEETGLITYIGEL